MSSSELRSRYEEAGHQPTIFVSYAGGILSLQALHETHAKCMYNGSMAVIQIRDLPDEVHTQLRVKAAEAGLSLSAYLRRELETLARSKSVAEILGRSDHLRTPLKKGNVLNAVHETRR